jgi:AcrR family transcriptional regulator
MSAIAEHVKPRSYDRSRRETASKQTRQRIVAAARELMVERGYRRTSVAAVAAAAGVHVDTVYQLVGRKPQLLRELLEQAISGDDHAVPAEQRDYVADIRAAPDAVAKLRIYAAATRGIHMRLAPIAQVVNEAAPSEPDVAALWNEITERRAMNMRDFVRDVQASAPLRPELSLDDAADIVWTLNSTEVFLLLTGRRRWPLEQYERWLADTWSVLLLAEGIDSLDAG